MASSLRLSCNCSSLFLLVGGKSIQDESDQIVQQHGRVADGHVTLTGAGKLPCMKVIHAVGPKWKDGKSGEQKVLYDCVFGHILKLTNQENLASIAIPAISAGAFGFPVSVSTSIIVEAVKDFLDNSSSLSCLREIHVIDNTQESGLAFASAIEEQFKDYLPTTTHTQQNVHLSTIKGMNYTAFLLTLFASK